MAVGEDGGYDALRSGERRPTDRLRLVLNDLDRLCDGIYRTVEPTNPLGLLQEALMLSITAEPIEKRIRVDGVKTGRVTALDLPTQIQQATTAGIISETEAAMLRDYDRKVMEIVNVDDFAPHELGVQAARRESAAQIA